MKFAYSLVGKRLFSAIGEDLSSLNDKRSLWECLLTKYRTNNISYPFSIEVSDRIINVSTCATPYSILMMLNNENGREILIAKMNNRLYDLDRHLEGPGKLSFLDFSDKDGCLSFWNTAAFLMNYSIHIVFGGNACRNEVTSNGFYCDSFLDGRNLSPSDYEPLKEAFSEIVKSNKVIERLDVPFGVAKSIFNDDYHKSMHLGTLDYPDTQTVSLYRCGDFIDISNRPLLRRTGQIRHDLSVITSVSSAKLRPTDADNILQRIYGIAFPNSETFNEWISQQEEAKKRDHRLIGEKQKLFFFHNSSPGSPFLLPNGTHIYNSLVKFIREQYAFRDFMEVSTPCIFNNALWQTSGHWDHYQNNMFQTSTIESMSIKPMNCPAHCLIYAHEERSWKDLPIRISDFGVLHRNEPVGTLSGLTRVIKFHQDDAHIFCRQDQIGSEIKATLDFLDFVYKTFGFEYELALSTRPKPFLGDESMWDFAEQQLRNCLDETGHKWIVNPGDGAFYGPKIDVNIRDAMNRHHQCATIQLDFQLPIRFDLRYHTENSEAKYDRPVIIHRAILGSVERFMAILMESNGGKWPFWLNPKQIMVIPVSRVFNNHVSIVKQQISSSGFKCDVDLDSSTSLNSKIRTAQMNQYNCILVVGQKEIDADTVILRTRNGKVHGSWKIDSLIRYFQKWQMQRTYNIDDDL